MIAEDRVAKLGSWSQIERALDAIANERERTELALQEMYVRQRQVWQRARDLGFTCAVIAVPSRLTRSNVQVQTEARRRS